MSQFSVDRDSNNTPTFGIGFVDGVNFQLVGNAPDLAVTIPAVPLFKNKTVIKVLVGISKGQDVFIAKNSPVILPVAGVLSTTIKQAINPSLRVAVKPGDILNFRSRDDADVQLEFFTEEAGPE